MIDNGFDNLMFVPRVVNNLLQASWARRRRSAAS